MITLLCNISDNRLRITLLCKEEFWENKYFCHVNIHKYK